MGIVFYVGRLLASEATVKTFLTKHGINNIKSIKFVEPKFPKNEAARRCNDMLEGFAEALPKNPEEAEYIRQRLIKYCGVKIEHS